MLNRRGFGMAPAQSSQQSRIQQLVNAGLVTSAQPVDLASRSSQSLNVNRPSTAPVQAAAPAPELRGAVARPTTASGSASTPPGVQQRAVAHPLSLPEAAASGSPAREDTPTRSLTPEPGDDGFEEMIDVFRRRNTIANHLKLIFERASVAECTNMACAGRLRWLHRYATAYRDGAASGGFYILLEGMVIVQGNGEHRQVRPNDPPAFFGLADACSGTSRTESAIAMRPSLLCYFPIPAASPHASRHAAIPHQTFLHYVLGRLETCSLFDASEFDYGRRQEQMRSLAGMLRPNTISVPGVRLLERGFISESCFLLVVGEVIVVSETEGKQTLRATVAMSPFVGEECLVRRGPSTATVTASSVPTLVLELAERHFSKLAWLRERARRRKAESDAIAGSKRRNSLRRDDGRAPPRKPSSAES